jgi:CS domain
MSERLAPAVRHKVVCEGRTIYEWTQTVQDVDVFVPLPDGITAKQLDVDIQSQHLRFGIKGNPPYLDVRRCRCRHCSRAGAPAHVVVQADSVDRHCLAYLAA